jgi:hypothetical protein
MITQTIGSSGPTCSRQPRGSKGATPCRGSGRETHRLRADRAPKQCFKNRVTAREPNEFWQQSLREFVDL